VVQGWTEVTCSTLRAGAATTGFVAGRVDNGSTLRDGAVLNCSEAGSVGGGLTGIAAGVGFLGREGGLAFWAGCSLVTRSVRVEVMVRKMHLYGCQ
jgi:hypothetical protein